MTGGVIDAHMHQWSVTDNDWYTALQPFSEQVGTPSLYSDFLPADYRAAAGDLDVEKFVHVSATTAPRAYLDETRWVDALADREGLDLVIVGSVDPGLDADAIVADLEEQARSPRFRGIRVLTGLEPESPAAATVLDWLDRGGHVFDLVTQPESMQRWLDVLAGHPQLTVSLEHTGWPSATDAAGFDAWHAAIRACAARPGITCKVTGLGMATADLSIDLLRPWVETAIAEFGWDRVMFGSNMPIETMAGTYRQWIGALHALLAEASATERRHFYTDTAATTYRIR
ncbi:amidohydrolase family protein [Tomitella fengzijianii]|uniref:Amidohydrolase family protein n=1 Tax=Tomitella fengzijianii TaxID=2597660 RepID=A0A516X378_9ACTN|nr:amidohydrolase family protein [Tomitella fengzijianii]QDQ97507.1 amidohydrolase family protein [Tomitella fengzijianii]